MSGRVADAALRAFRRTTFGGYAQHARALANRTQGQYIGVVFATNAHAASEGNRPGTPAWYIYVAPSHDELHAWFLDWSGTPSTHYYVAMFDKNADDWQNENAPIAFDTGVSMTTSVSGAPESTRETFDRLAHLIALHERWFGELGRANAHSAKLRSFLHRTWDPYFTRWGQLRAHVGDVDVDFIAELARGLSDVRAIARSKSIPLPGIDHDYSALRASNTLRGLDQGANMTSVSGGGGHHGGGGHGGGGHHGHGGFFRRGSRFPGRWWGPGWGWDGYWYDYPYWVESDVNLLLDENPPEPQDALPPPSTTDVPIAPEAQGTPDPAHTTSVGGWVDPLVAQINRETDLRFWRQTGYKPGSRLDPKNADDRRMVPQWVAIRYQVARDVHDGIMKPDAWDEAFDRTFNPVIVGAISARRQTSDLVAIAPMVAPTAHPFTASLQLSPAGDQLCARICIDGVCYEGCADVSAIAHQLAAFHAQLHAAPHALVAGDLPAYPLAAQNLICGMVNEHVVAMCCGWFDSIKHAISSAAHGVVHGISSAAGSVGHTLKKLKGPIAAAAGIAAGGAALAIPGVGPLVAPMAGSLASSLVNAAAGDGDVKQAAQAAVSAAETAAQSDPHVKAALDAAHQAVAQTTAAYHTVETAANAAKGDKTAAAQISELAMAADAGDAAAKKALAVATAATSGAADKTAVSGWLLPLAAGLGGFGAGYYGPDALAWAKQKYAEHKARKAA